jgi:hypothetical protein
MGAMAVEVEYIALARVAVADVGHPLDIALADGQRGRGEEPVEGAPATNVVVHR